MKAQATMKDVKKPVSQSIGRGATKVTMGTVFGLGRFGYRFTTGFLKGCAEAGGEIKRGYDEAKAAADEAAAEANAQALAEAAKE